MIMEIFSNEVKGRLQPSNAVGDDPPYLTLADLEPLFEKMGLAVPRDGEDVVKTSEGGYNLMLNQYGAVLRLYPSPKAMDNDQRVSHGYHPRTIPPIGVVQFDEFVMQIMPGVSHTLNSEDGLEHAVEETRKDTGLADENIDNYGSINGKAKLLDTVLNIDFRIYDQYAFNGVLDRLVDEYACFEDLQQSFSDAWSEKQPFEMFWAQMEDAKDEGRLIDGWNNSTRSMLFGKKGNIVEAAKSYEHHMQDVDADAEHSL